MFESVIGALIAVRDHWDQQDHFDRSSEVFESVFGALIALWDRQDQWDHFDWAQKCLKA